MAVTVGLVRPVAQISSSTTPTIYNVSALLANTEYSQALTASTRMFTIRVRGASSLKLYFAPAATDYITIAAGASYSVDQLNFTGTLYFQTSKPTQTVEILEWV